MQKKNLMKIKRWNINSDWRTELNLPNKLYVSLSLFGILFSLDLRPWNFFVGSDRTSCKAKDRAHRVVGLHTCTCKRIWLWNGDSSFRTYSYFGVATNHQSLPCSFPFQWGIQKALANPTNSIRQKEEAQDLTMILVLVSVKSNINVFIFYRKILGTR